MTSGVAQNDQAPFSTLTTLIGVDGGITFADTASGLPAAGTRNGRALASDDPTRLHVALR